MLVSSSVNSSSVGSNIQLGPPVLVNSIRNGVANSSVDIHDIHQWTCERIEHLNVQNDPKVSLQTDDKCTVHNMD